MYIYNNLIFFFSVQYRGLPLPFLFRTIPREKNYIVGQIEEMQKENGVGEREEKKKQPCKNIVPPLSAS